MYLLVIFVYQDQLNPIAEMYPDGGIKSLFIYVGQDARVSSSTGSMGTTADKTNIPSAMQRYDELGNLEASYRIISNHLGSVTMVIDAETLEVMQEITYAPWHKFLYDSKESQKLNAWGNVLSDSNPNFQPFYFAGGIYDTDTKLTRFGARDYAVQEVQVSCRIGYSRKTDAQTGRWTAKDPIGFDGGLTSLYDYVGGDPVNFVDPAGTQSYQRMARPVTYNNRATRRDVMFRPNKGWRHNNLLQRDCNPPVKKE